MVPGGDNQNSDGVRAAIRMISLVPRDFQRYGRFTKWKQPWTTKIVKCLAPEMTTSGCSDSTGDMRSCTINGWD